MQEVTIKDVKRICFLVKDGEANKIVIPIDRLAPIDYKRISELDSKGGELMKHMRETTMDNGVNALKLYENLLVVVPKEVVKDIVHADKKESVEKEVVNKPTRRRGKTVDKS